VHVIVGFPAGYAPDILARMLGERLSARLGVPFVIENRPGAGTQIATEAVARAAPDGNTILFLANSFIINAGLRKVGYDPLVSFEPVCLLTRSPNVVVVNSASPYRSLSDLIADARAKAGALSFAFQGPGTSQHIGTEKLKRMAGIDAVNVPFTGSAPAVNAILGGHVAALFVNYPALAEQVSAGKLRVLATASRTRLESLPDVPTIAEALHGDFEEDVWTGAVVPAKTPKETVSQLADWFGAAVLEPALRPKLTVQGFDAAGTCGADFAAFLGKQVGEYGRIIREADIKPE
jgi:tripartite-type tricarboxylate transporter receptor subunit TctC